MKNEIRPIPYISGTAENYASRRHRQIPLDVGDTCLIVGGSAFIQGNILRTAWPSLRNDRLVALPSDHLYLNSHSLLPTEQVNQNMLPLTLENPKTIDEAKKKGYIVSDHQVFRTDGIRYRGLGEGDLAALKDVYEKCFGYPIAPDIVLALFTQTGGHIGGIFEGDEMVGFTTILAAHLLTESRDNALFVDSIGVIPSKRNLHLASFALQVVELAAVEANVSHIALTHKDELSGFYGKNGFEKRLWMENIYGPGESRHYSVKKLSKADNG
jgi:hypothetical protein